MEGCKANGNLCKNAIVRRTITVHASSELACKPDVFSLAVSVSSTKESAEAAQNSVRRRSDYILQVLRNNGIKKKRVERSTDVSRAGEDEVSVRVELLAEAESVQACEAARNVLVAKLDATVHCSAVEPRHSPAHGAEMRRRVFQEAVVNAREKAASVAQLLGVRLGPALEVEEIANHHHEIRGASPSTSSDQPESQVTPDPPSLPSLQQRVKEATETYSAAVRVKFEVSPLRACHHRSCPKH